MKEKNKFYAEEIKLKAIEMKSAGVINGDLQRLKQPIGKQYSYGHGPKVTSE